MNFKALFKIKPAAWHVGALIVVIFLTLSVRQGRLERIDSEAAATTWVGEIETIFFDWRLRARGTRPASGRVGILAIDEKAIGQFGRWPFPRSTYAPAFANLKAAGVKWIGLDVIFSESENLLLNDALEPMETLLIQSMSPTGAFDPRRFLQGVTDLLKTSPGDLALGQAIRDFGNVVQAFAILSPDEGRALERDWSEARKNLTGSLASFIRRKGSFFAEQDDEFFPLTNVPTIAGKSPIYGYMNNLPDNDGILRVASLITEIPQATANNKPQEKSFIPSLSLQLAAKYLNRKIDVTHSDSIEKISLIADEQRPIDIPLTRSSGSLLISHYGNHTDARGNTTPVRISLADAVENTLPKDVPEILLLGSTTIGIDDRRPSPINSTANGVEHHVAVIENIINQDFLKRPPQAKILELAFLLIFGVILCILLRSAPPIMTLMILAITHAVLEFVDHKFLFSSGRIINFSLLHLQNSAIFISMTSYRFIIEEREKRKVKGAFQHYLNPSVINQVLESPDGLKLGGEKRELTVFFSDVRGFTTISERLSPETLAGLLNEYFTPMTDIVLQSGGLLDKYIGDALMAVWGAPLTIHDHADRALHSSLKMLDALDPLREGWKSRQLPALDIGCGINTGPMVVGNMGSAQRFDYTVLGDAVNLGARLEGITKEYGVRIICSDSTAKALRRPDDFVLRELDWIKVKGKNEHVTIYEVLRFSKEKKEHAKQVKALFEEGLRAYRAKDFMTAQLKMLEVLKVAPQDGPAGVFLERCEYLTENPPDEGWDGIWVMKSK